MRSDFLALPVGLADPQPFGVKTDREVGGVSAMADLFVFYILYMCTYAVNTAECSPYME
jgi:hypothetical protein